MNACVSVSYAIVFFSFSSFVLFNLLCFVLFYFIFFILLLFLRSLFFSNEKQKVLDLDGRGDGEELEGVEDGKTIIIICHMRKNIFNKI